MAEGHNLAYDCFTFFALLYVINSLYMDYSCCFQTLDDRLDDYVEDKSLVSKKPFVTVFPPEFEPIPCRPLFFDLALNHIDFPSLEDKLESSQKKQAGAGGGGLSGFVKGWLWGGGGSEKK